MRMTTTQRKGTMTIDGCNDFSVPQSADGPSRKKCAARVARYTSLSIYSLSLYIYIYIGVLPHQSIRGFLFVWIC